ncbi:MAG: DsbA family protein [Actinomycetota bacterium]|nr:DsbA family protein [Actinomycetota bacterium]
MAAGAMVFHFDLASPYAYLSAERLAGRADVDWQPVLVGAMFGWRGHGSWAQTEARGAHVAEIERRVAADELPPLRWPEGWPVNSLQAMRAALWAGEAARGGEFTLSAFRRGFQRGEDLAHLGVLQEVAGEVGLDAAALPAATADPGLKSRLKEVTVAAYARGVAGVPSFIVGEGVFYGDDHLEQALAALRAG